jgi:hypothetical protein
MRAISSNTSFTILPTASRARTCGMGPAYVGQIHAFGVGVLKDLARWDGRPRLLNGIDVPKWKCCAST